MIAYNKAEIEKIKTEIENENTQDLIVPNKLKHPHPITQNVYNEIIADTKLHKDREMYSASNSRFFLKISKNTLGRAILVLDTLIKLIEKRGHQLPYNTKYSHIMLFDRVCCEIYIREKTIKQRVNTGGWERDEYIGVGKLIISSRFKEWSETNNVTIESKLSRVLAYLEVDAQELMRHWDENKKREEERKKQIEFQLEQKRIREDELNNFKKLLNEANRWHQTKLLREYLAFLENTHSKDKQSEEFYRWLNWAKRKADWYDPQVNADDDTLGEVNKELLTI